MQGTKWYQTATPIGECLWRAFQANHGIRRNLRKDVCVSAEELDLFYVNFGPAIYNFLNNLLRFVLWLLVHPTTNS